MWVGQQHVNPLFLLSGTLLLYTKPVHMFQEIEKFCTFAECFILYIVKCFGAKLTESGYVFLNVLLIHAVN